jgi:hypothetical protein
MEVIDEYRVVARNTATTSSNKIHDDAVARRYGFAGGLVPGVDVYAYMTHPPASAWGIDWLTRGTMRARFGLPVYEGEEVVVLAAEIKAAAAGPRLALELRGPDGTIRATGEAALPSGAGISHGRSGDQPWRESAPAVDPPPASPASLATGTALALPPHGFHADEAATYLAEVGEALSLYADRRVAHPGWLLRDANRVLSANVRLGPWIHVESVVRHCGVVHDGDTIATRAAVTREWESKGHRFVELDVGQFVATPDGERAVARTIHTAIYQPRALDA